jgi:hypothetical protein
MSIQTNEEAAVNISNDFSAPLLQKPPRILVEKITPNSYITVAAVNVISHEEIETQN